MMLRRSQALPYLWERKRFTGPLDIRTPEDRPVVEQQNAPAAPIRSPAIDKALGDFGEAMRSGVVDAMKHAAKSVVDATSAYYRMSGVPTFAHDPVPWQLIEHALPVEHLAPGEHADQAVGRFVDVFDHSVKPMLRDQVMKHLGRGGADDWRSQFRLLRDGLEGESPNLSTTNRAFEMRTLPETAESLMPSEDLSLNEKGAARFGRSIEAPKMTLLPGGNELARSNWIGETQHLLQQDSASNARTLEYDPRRGRPRAVELQDVFDPYEASKYLPPEERDEFLREIRRGGEAAAYVLGQALYELSPLPQARDFANAVRSGDYASAAIAVLMVLPAFKGVRISHHIIARSSKHHAALRIVMRDFGIDIDDTDNLARMMEEAHRVLHTNNYYDYVRNRVLGARNADELRAVLRDIKGLLEGLRDRTDSRKYFPPQTPRR